MLRLVVAAGPRPKLFGPQGSQGDDLHLRFVASLTRHAYPNTLTTPPERIGCLDPKGQPVDQVASRNYELQPAMSLQAPQLPQTPLSPRFPRLPFPTTVHPFTSPTKDACAYESGPSSAENALVFIGGLGDGPHSVPYPQAIAQALEDHGDLGYSVFQFRLGSSFNQFGFKRLVDDVADIAALVEYLRSIGKKSIVLMGHSTGTQVTKTPHAFRASFALSRRRRPAVPAAWVLSSFC